MKTQITLVLYCAEIAEFVCKSIDKPHILQEKMFIAFANLMFRVEKVLYIVDTAETIVCCGTILKVMDGKLEGSRLSFPFGKIPAALWNHNKFDGWTVYTADAQWDSFLSPIINIVGVDGDKDNYTGEE